MKSLRNGCLLAACASALPAQDSASPPPSPIAGYTRSLDGALERVRERVGSTVDIWVDHSTWENAWVVESDDYRVRTTHSYGLGKSVADGLQVMLGHFQTTLETDFLPPSRLPINLLPDVAAYNAAGGNYDEHSSFYGSFYANQDAGLPVQVIYDPNVTRLQMAVTHSAVHQYLGAAFPGTTPPVWVSEGLAAYFSAYWAYNYCVDQWEAMRDKDELIPLGNLLGDPLAAYVNNANQRFFQLGMLFDYLLNHNDDTRTSRPGEDEQRAPFRDYLLSLINGDADTESRVHEMLRRPAALEQALKLFQFPR